MLSNITLIRTGFSDYSILTTMLAMIVAAMLHMPPTTSPTTTLTMVMANTLIIVDTMVPKTVDTSMTSMLHGSTVIPVATVTCAALLVMSLLTLSLEWPQDPRIGPLPERSTLM